MTEPRRDRWGRYLLPDPNTGEERAWTRATTWAKTLSDTWGLVDWKLRMGVKGIALRDDLLALATALPLEAGKKQLNEVARDAVEAAGGGRGRNLGNALHEWTAQIDRGEEPVIRPPWDRDVDAYTAALGVHGIRVIPDYVERIVCVAELGVAGTFDRIVAWDPEAYVLDVKSGASVEFSWGEWAVQLALYANADHLWEPEAGDAGEWVPMPKVNTNDAIVAHLPAGEARCDLYLVDLDIGWGAALLAHDVREWRKREDIARQIGTEMLGRSPVQPVLELDGAGHSGSASPTVEDSPAAATAPEPASDPAHETEGEDVTALLVAASSPAGDDLVASGESGTAPADDTEVAP